MSAHTAGPWDAQTVPGGDVLIWGQGETGDVPVAVVYRFAGAEANGKLIAAAPMMAEALKTAARMLAAIHYPDDGTVGNLDGLRRGPEADAIRAALRAAGVIE